jgi:hypothetical protein
MTVTPQAIENGYLSDFGYLTHMNLAMQECPLLNMNPNRTQVIDEPCKPGMRKYDSIMLNFLIIF